jgi:hypothetical protein
MAAVISLIDGSGIWQRLEFLDRLVQLCLQGKTIGWGVGDDFADLWSQAALAD